MKCATQFPFHDVGVGPVDPGPHRKKGIPGDASGTVAHELVHCNRFLHASWLFHQASGPSPLLGSAAGTTKQLEEGILWECNTCNGKQAF